MSLLHLTPYEIQRFVNSALLKQYCINARKLIKFDLESLAKTLIFRCSLMRKLYRHDVLPTIYATMSAHVLKVKQCAGLNRLSVQDFCSQ